MKKFKFLLLSIFSLFLLSLYTKTTHADDASPTNNMTTYAHLTTDPGTAYNKWYYKYTAEPYDFYYNPFKGTWKMVQKTSTTNHLVQTIFNGWATSGPWVPRIY